MPKKCYIENEGNATLSMDDIYYYSINNSLLFLANILFGNYRLPIEDAIFVAIQWTKRSALRWHSVFGGCGVFLCLPRLLLGAAFSVFAHAKNSSRIGFSCSSRFLYLSSLVSLEYFFSRLYMLAIG